MTATLTLEVRDTTGQKRVRATGIDPEARMDEFIDSVLDGLHLPRTTQKNAPIPYHARLEREGRHLISSERVGAATEQLDELVIHPSVDAG